ncbi:hypothetical protein AALO_G00110260 [Alosa alosa]|uniref:Uncharacterized protein n=1 Tax=Alosa alosa TaxID=278164 RepID=A0AAV6GNX8_9TELE|nr:hypothetical protein AALO_G00110260 [Alosa alosa]
MQFAGSESSKAMFSPTHIPDPAQFTAATQDCYSDLHTTLFQSSFRRLTIWHKMIGNKRHPVMSSPECELINTQTQNRVCKATFVPSVPSRPSTQDPSKSKISQISSCRMHRYFGQVLSTVVTALLYYEHC